MLHSNNADVECSSQNTGDLTLSPPRLPMSARYITNPMAMVEDFEAGAEIA